MEEEGQLAQQRTDATFAVRRFKDDQPSAASILNDIRSAKSAAEYYREEILKRHQSYELEKQWPYLSPEDVNLIEYY